MNLFKHSSLSPKSRYLETLFLNCSATLLISEKNMADQNSKKFLNSTKISTTKFVRVLIPSAKLNFQNLQWWIQYGGPKL